MADDPRRRAEPPPAAVPSEAASARHETRSERGGNARSRPASLADREPGATTVGAALRAVERRLEAAGIEGARLESTLLLGHVLGLARAQLIAAFADPLSGDQARELHALATRRAAREPLQYLRGLAPFLDFELEVGPGVFIPRPETEQLVERALELWDPTAGRWAVDAGTGSGAIAIGLARGKPDGLILAIDQNPIALATARRNAERLGVADRILYARSDLLAAIRPSAIGIIVSNPPYVVAGDEVDPEVRNHEPHEAWAAGPTGLEAYERIVPAAAALLPARRWLVLELGYGQQAAVSDLLEACGGWNAPTIDPDFQGIPRVLAARRAPDS
jgi:release factor glutamine methyltransferase